jgi:hypothetical protein
VQQLLPDLKAEVGGQQNDEDVECNGEPYQGTECAKSRAVVIELQAEEDACISVASHSYWLQDCRRS